MLHIHFGAGRLGLGLVAPFLQSPQTELYLLNRATSASKATGSTALDPARRNRLLEQHPRKEYVLATPGGPAEAREVVKYEGFLTYHDDAVEDQVREILSRSQTMKDGVVVTASVLTIGHYAPVVGALNAICEAKSRQADAIGDVYLIACENTVSAHEVLKDEKIAGRLSETTRRHLHCVHALVDRVCVELEEAQIDGEPTVLVRAEEYGSLKLELCPDTEDLKRVLQGTSAEFSHHLHVEKEIKGWLLNGSHWLIALTALKESGGNTDVKLNEFIIETEDHQRYASEVVQEMRDGIEALLRSDPEYASFVEDVDVSAYLDGAAASILKRFQANEDTLSRILARFKTPTPDAVTTVQSFVDRFLHKIEPPLLAYQEEKGAPAKSATQGVFNLFRLQASGTYVDSAEADESEERKTA